MAILSEMGEVTEGMMDTKVNAIEDIHLYTLGPLPKSHTVQVLRFMTMHWLRILSHTDIKIPSLSNRLTCQKENLIS